MSDTLNLQRARPLLQNCDLPKLFVEELGWEPSRQKLTLRAGETDFAFTAIAQKRGFIAWLCESPSGDLPNHATRLKLDRKLSETSFEHLIVFVTGNRASQSWTWVRREPGKPLAARTHEYHRGQPGDSLLQKINNLYVSLEEEEAGLSTVAVAGRARAAFDIERVTKAFYRDFDTHRKAFLKFIVGISAVADREWYASVMLNRLMFVYFIQRKGFLDGDHNYLRNRLDRCKEEQGKDKFYSFYRYFLLRLFHEGFGKRRKDRSPDLEKLLGNIPYLNGGLFDVHELEKPERYGKDIQISDQAFERVFNYFDQYQWHLDERPLRKDDEINPDVLGYIFEKYINQKQMGAYYTKEDITEYISKNTVLPFLFDAARAKCKVAFENSSGPTVWDVLRENPARYIYPAKRYGTELKLPPEIIAGLDTTKPLLAERRKTWSQSAPAEFALPTEIWREVIARRQRYEEVREKLAAGEVREINDFITLNLDLRQFAQDVIQNCEGPDLLMAFWQAITTITVLDPTGGSGAFIFAALNILEPLYEACLDRMEVFLTEWGDKGHKVHPNYHKKFTEVLFRVDAHPNRRYFVLKSIILNNLYAVDIMEEAVEICKLRLFLKLAAQVEPDVSRDNLGIEPLPDIDFNIRAGNTLVGYATYDEVKHAVTSTLDFDNAMEKIAVKAADLQQTFDKFRQFQTEGDGSVPAADKQELQKRLWALEDELNHHLAGEYGVKVSDKGCFLKWVKSHQPFHWFVQFYGILNSGGFDVIIGNPPYVSFGEVNYLSKEMKGMRFPDIYALVLLRSLRLTSKSGRCGMIVPISVTFSSEFGLLRSRLCTAGAAWFSSYDNIPAAIFDGVSQRCTIWIGGKGGSHCFSTPMYRWRSVFRQHLMESLTYVPVETEQSEAVGLPKLYSRESAKVLAAIHAPVKKPQRHVMSSGRNGGHSLGFSQAARNFISVFKDPPPYLEASSLKSVPSSKVGYVSCGSDAEVNGALVSLAGELYFYYWLIRGDGFDVTSWIIKDYLRCLDYLPHREFNLLVALGELLHERRFEGLVFKKNAGKYVGNFNFQNHFAITRRADLLVLAGLGIGRNEALDPFDRVQRVLAINESAGEKGIPENVKRKFLPKNIDATKQKKLFREIDAILTENYGFSAAELDFILNYDIKCRLDRDVGDGEEV